MISVAVYTTLIHFYLYESSNGGRIAFWTAGVMDLPRAIYEVLYKAKNNKSATYCGDVVSTVYTALYQAGPRERSAQAVSLKMSGNKKGRPKRDPTCTSIKSPITLRNSHFSAVAIIYWLISAL